MGETKDKAFVERDVRSKKESLVEKGTTEDIRTHSTIASFSYDIIEHISLMRRRTVRNGHLYDPRDFFRCYQFPKGPPRLASSVVSYRDVANHPASIKKDS